TSNPGGVPGGGTPVGPKGGELHVPGVEPAKVNPPVPVVNELPVKVGVVPPQPLDRVVVAGAVRGGPDQACAPLINLLTERGEVGGGVQSLPTEEDRCPVRVPRINSHTVLLSSPREPERPRIGVLPNRLP